MTRNPILDELHQARKKLLEEAGGTLDALVDRLQAEEAQSDRPRFDSRQTTRASGLGEVAKDNQSLPPSD
jgi:hypothetical protein